MLVTTTSMTTVRVSTRNDQSISSAPEVRKRNTVTLVSVSPKPTSKNAIHDSTAAMTRKPLVMVSHARAPIARPKKPAMMAPNSGRKTIAEYMAQTAPPGADPICVAIFIPSSG
jgi:hypothetical protein